MLKDTGDEDLILARITSQPVHSAFDVELRDWQESGLILPSWVRVHKLATPQKQLVERKLGCLTQDNWVLVMAQVRALGD